MVLMNRCEHRATRLSADDLLFCDDCGLLLGYFEENVLVEV